MTLTFLPYRVASSTSTADVCPLCGQPLPLAPAPFYVLVRIRGEALRLADGLEFGGNRVWTDGEVRRTEVIRIVRVQS